MYINVNHLYRDLNYTAIGCKIIELFLLCLVCWVLDFSPLKTNMIFNYFRGQT